MNDTLGTSSGSSGRRAALQLHLWEIFFFVPLIALVTHNLLGRTLENVAIDLPRLAAGAAVSWAVLVLYFVIECQFEEHRGTQLFHAATLVCAVATGFANSVILLSACPQGQSSFGGVLVWLTIFATPSGLLAIFRTARLERRFDRIREQYGRKSTA